ncbi:unnamed protein product [Pleuronectes platessa]|uniref:Uncharacterized protein n=1 Tax=Pleuronectes platessa TaxID=8262 RepID=A0A9N7Y4Y8_PLEPL|nr:unnamed protein product [Pleuronectes platessa]
MSESEAICSDQAGEDPTQRTGAGGSVSVHRGDKLTMSTLRIQATPLLPHFLTQALQVLCDLSLFTCDASSSSSPARSTCKSKRAQRSLGPAAHALSRPDLDNSLSRSLRSLEGNL